MEKQIKVDWKQINDSKQEATITYTDEPIPRKEIPGEQKQEVLSGLRQWLGPQGVRQFSYWQEEHGTVSPVLFFGPIPHAVHFREGMQVRNYLRSVFGEDWTAHEYDDNWQWLVEEAIALDEPFEEPEFLEIPHDGAPIIPIPKKKPWWKFWG